MPRDLRRITIDHQFSLHKVDEKGVEQMKRIFVDAREMARTITEVCPEGREKDGAINYIYSAVALAHSAISQEYPVDPNSI